MRFFKNASQKSSPWAGEKKTCAILWGSAQKDEFKKKMETESKKIEK